MKSKVSNLNVLGVLSIVFWIYLILKVFVVDVDVYLVQKFAPSLLPILNFRLFILLAIFSLLLFLKGTKKILLNLSFLIIYPAIILFVVIPWQLIKYRNWNGGFLLVGFLGSLFKSIRFNFITLSLLIICTLIINLTTNEYILSPIGIFIFVYICLLYIRTFIYIFKSDFQFVLPEWIFKGGKKFINIMFEGNKAQKINTIKEEATINTTETTLQIAVIYNQVLLFLASKFKVYQKSKIYYLITLFRLMLLFIITNFGFSLIYFILYKLDSLNFEGSKSIFSFLDFIALGFSNGIGSDLPYLNSIGSIAVIISVLQKNLFAVIILIIIISVLLTFKNKKTEDDIEKIISQLKKESKEIDTLTQQEYKVSISTAMKGFENVKTGLFDIINYLSANIVDEIKESTKET